jgi:hypothetical protein
MPFRHVVMFRWADHVDADQIEAIRDGLSRLPSQIDAIRGFVHGSDVGVSEGNWDYVVVADFDNVGDFITYRDHPSHLLFIEERVKGNVADRAAVQYQYGGH